MIASELPLEEPIGPSRRLRGIRRHRVEGERLKDEREIGDRAVLEDVPIDVGVVDRVVRLTSDATNADQRSRALAVVRALPGVAEVEDDLK